jgi:hypothetical protein
MLHPVLPPDPPLILEPLEPASHTSTASAPKFSSVVETQTQTQGNKDKSKPQKDLPQLANAGKTESYRHLSTPINATQNDLVVAETLSKPDTPETFPPEFSPINAPSNAALLGQPQAVGYPMQEVAASNLQNVRSRGAERSLGGESKKAEAPEPIDSISLKSPSPQAPTTFPLPLVDASNPEAPQVNPKVTSSKNLLQPQPPLISKKLPEKLTQQQQSDSTAQQSQGQINFPESSNENAPSSQPVQNIIEFKSRSPTTQPTAPRTIEFQSETQQNQPLTPVTPGNPTNQPQKPSGQTPPAKTQPATPRVVEVTSDSQEYDEQRRIITAIGKVVVRFDGAVVNADRLQVNLDNLIAAGEGNVVLTRGDQILQGQRFTYNFVQDSGELYNGGGEIYVPTTQTDFAFSSPDVTPNNVPRRSPSETIRANQPLSGVSSSGALNLAFGSRTNASNFPTPKTGGIIKRLRFEAQRIDFYPRGWQARNARITNDPFSPPELEIRADKVTLTREAPLIDRITTQRQRLVFDQKLTVPIPVDQQTIDRREQEVSPAIVSPGFDGDDRGGLYIERGFKPFNTDQVKFTITPQFFVQKAALGGGTSDLASLFGVTSKLNAILSPTAVIQGSGELTSFDLNKVDENLRGSLRLRQILGDRNPHILNLEYSYRDRLYNGTLGFQTVQSSLGGVITSPVIPLGQSGINLTYQAGAQYINANTDRLDLLEPIRENNRISLGRFQASATLSKGFLLWQGKPLAATATEGLRYTPNPVVPYLQAFTSLTGTSNFYTNGDNQSTLIGTVGLLGQLGHFSRPYFDYTAFNVSYSQGLNSGLSPFLFDRSVDNRVLSAGISQQIYGPFRLGFQTSVNLDTGEQSSTDYFLEYSRRTYGITLRYNPVLELGGISIRISDFNWSGGTDPFSQVKPVVGGVVEQGN